MFLEAGINSYLSKEKKTGEEIFNIKQLQKQILSTSSKIKILNKIIEESTKLTDEDEEKVNMVKRWRYEAKVWSNELVSFPSNISFQQIGSVKEITHSDKPFELICINSNTVLLVIRESSILKKVEEEINQLDQMGTPVVFS